jgi:hypothetical protein
MCPNILEHIHSCNFSKTNFFNIITVIKVKLTMNEYFNIYFPCFAVVILYFYEYLFVTEVGTLPSGRIQGLGLGGVISRDNMFCFGR